MQPSLLGLSMRLCQPHVATDNVWHVLDVIEGSPAESAGLVPMGDWIIGMCIDSPQVGLLSRHDQVGLGVCSAKRTIFMS